MDAQRWLVELASPEPGALDFARPLEGWRLPESSGLLRRRLEADHGSGGTKEYIAVLRLLEKHPLVRLKQAVGSALDQRHDFFDPPAVALSSASAVIAEEKVPLDDARLDVEMNVTAYLMPQHFLSMGSEVYLEQGCQQLVGTFEESTLDTCRAVRSGSAARVQELRSGPAVRDISDEPTPVLEGD